MQRRHFLGATPAALGAALAASTSTHAAMPPGVEPAPATTWSGTRAIAPMRASVDRLVDLSVCTRPFREQGPRIESEQRYGKTIVHHYGHGGSGWSLSWGSARVAMALVLPHRPRHLAVIGSGAIGLTTARVAQRAGLRVRIYCKDRPPEVRSSAATGLWTPDSRICSSAAMPAGFAAQWETMARSSFRTYQSLLGLPGEPVEWRDGIGLSDVPFDQPLADDDGEPDYPDLSARIADIHPRPRALAPHEHPFRVPYARRFTQMTFNIASYQRLLMDDFLREGGTFETREFTHPREFGGLREPVVVNCTGYGARALLGDDSIVPVRGQTARLVPQPEVDYMIAYRGHNLVAIPRRDGILVATQEPHDFGNADAAVDRGVSERAVERLAALFA
jgi:glycine/D-amino acid oxidase-like deaminating enzyme